MWSVQTVPKVHRLHMADGKSPAPLHISVVLYLYFTTNKALANFSSISSSTVKSSVGSKQNIKSWQRRVSGLQKQTELKVHCCHSYHEEAFLLLGHSSGIIRKGAVPRERMMAQNTGYKEKKNCCGTHTSEVTTSSSFADLVVALINSLLDIC